jgi:hypothetical protein
LLVYVHVHKLNIMYYNMSDPLVNRDIVAAVALTYLQVNSS